VVAAASQLVPIICPCLFVRVRFRSQASGMVRFRPRWSESVAGSEGLYSPRWSPGGEHPCALSIDSKKLFVYDFKTQKRTEWLDEKGVNGFPTWCRNAQFVVYFDATFSDKATYRRFKVGQTHSEFLLLKGVHPYPDPTVGNWSGLSPDESVYALTLEDEHS
jgi:hypothetical protein